MVDKLCYFCGAPGAYAVKRHFAAEVANKKHLVDVEIHLDFSMTLNLKCLCDVCANQILRQAKEETK